MTINLNVVVCETKTIINLPDNTGKLTIISRENITELQSEMLLLFVSHGQVVALSDHQLPETELAVLKVDQAIGIETPWELEQDYLISLFNKSLPTLKYYLINENILSQVPKAIEQIVINYFQMLESVLKAFGLTLTQKSKKTPGKPRHRWTKEIADIDFFVNTRESQATVRWIKRNEMLIKAGAKLKSEVPLNKDGSIGFVAKMGDKIRSDHEKSLENFVTTEDIILKSVNEVGLFLYFGGLNSWLVLVDQSGKTINEWTVIS